MQVSSAFIDMAAVEAWDAWFRWRDGSELHDLSVQDTWARVARALAQAEPPLRADPFETALVDAMATWRLLLDESLLVTAGTGSCPWPDDELVGVINLAAFVQLPGTPDARLDWVGVETTAELAVHALDNATMLAKATSTWPGLHLRIGVMGLADALILLGERYDSSYARRLGHDMAQTLASGCLRGSMRLAHERGARYELSSHSTLAYKLRQLSTRMANDATRTGLRHARLTAITSQPRLALLANNAADAVDPMVRQGGLHTIDNGAVARPPGSQGYALEILRRKNVPMTQLSPLLCDACHSNSAQMEMRAAMQMWIDQPILYPLQSQFVTRSGEYA